MSDSTSILSNVAVAPRHPLGQKGHIRAYRLQGKLAPSDTLGFNYPTNPWRGGSPGSVFFDTVLKTRPASVGAALELAKSKGISEVEAQAHLRWLFTWGKLEVNGKLHGDYLASAPALAPVAPQSAPEPKAQASKPKSPKAKASK